MKQQTNLQNWKEKTLDEVAEFINGRAFKPSEWKKEGLPIIRIQNLTKSTNTINYSNEKYEDKYYINNEDILLAWSATLDVFEWKEGPALLNQHIFNVKPKNNLDKKFLYYLLKSILEKIKRKTHGTGMKHITKPKLLEVKTLLPESKETQSLIVSAIEQKFSKIDNAIKNLKTARAKIQLYRKAVLKKAFEKKEGWEEKTLNELCLKINDGTHFTPKYQDKGIKFISVKDIRDNKIDFSNCKYISKEEHKILYKRCNPEKGDVLITKSGTIGRTAIVETDEIFDLFVSVALLKPNREMLNSKFLMYFLEWYVKSINIDQKIKGAVVKNFHIEDIKSTNISFPPSLATQQSIVADIESKFSVIDKVEEAVNNSLAKAEKLKKSILKSAFEGRLVKNE